MEPNAREAKLFVVLNHHDSQFTYIKSVKADAYEKRNMA